MTKTGKLLIALCATGLLSVADEAFATKGHGKGKSADHVYEGKHENENRGNDNDDGLVTIVIGGSDRAVIQDYLGKRYNRNCPPGLAKKNNGCLPPGMAKKYRLGHALPDQAVWSPIPNDLFDLLGKPPHGYKYVQVDEDVLLINEATKKVLDAVTLISGVGK